MNGYQFRPSFSPAFIAGLTLDLLVIRPIRSEPCEEGDCHIGDLGVDGVAVDAGGVGAVSGELRFSGGGAGIEEGVSGRRRRGVWFRGRPWMLARR